MNQAPRDGALVHFGPGSALPAWVEALEREAFGQCWGTLEAREEAWALDGLGYIQWGLIPQAGEAELLRIAVRPEGRGQGVGGRILRESTEALAAMGIRELHLEVRISNTSARRLYEREGWRRTGLRKGYYRDGEDAALYGKEIPGLALLE